MVHSEPYLIMVCPHTEKSGFDISAPKIHIFITFQQNIISKYKNFFIQLLLLLLVCIQPNN